MSTAPAPYGTLVKLCGDTAYPMRPATRDEWQRTAAGWWDQYLRIECRVDGRPAKDPALLPDPPPEVGTLAGPYGLIIARSPHGTRIAAATRDEWVRHRSGTDGWTTLIGAPAEDPDPAEGERRARIAHEQSMREFARYSRR